MSERLPPQEQVVGCGRALVFGVSFGVGHSIFETEAQGIESDLSYFAVYQIT